ncbi:MAG: hypothetical protein ACXVEF_27015 [Polyangiales bacterium]
MSSRWMMVFPMVLVACASSATKQQPSRYAAADAASKKASLVAAKPAAPPPCLDVEKDAVLSAGTADEKGVPYLKPIDLSLDLDGDGVPDRVLETDRDGTTVRYELYVQKGMCPKKIGSLAVPGTLSLGHGMVNGMRVLEVEGLCLEGCCRSIQHEELVFDGTKWVPRRSWYVPKIC